VVTDFIALGLETRKCIEPTFPFGCLVGFATSSILAVIKGAEFQSAPTRLICADALFNASEDYGNSITLLNKPNIPETPAATS
jgi:hypothetical protein